VKKIRNLVAKHSKKFNKASVHRDKKKDEKSGKEKHKNKLPNNLKENEVIF
jgi:hypothetical protein